MGRWVGDGKCGCVVWMREGEAYIRIICEDGGKGVWVGEGGRGRKKIGIGRAGVGRREVEE